MRTRTPWWRWPEDRRTGRVAWFIIARRLSFSPLLWVGASLSFVGIFLMYGKRSAIEFWREL